MVKSIKTYSEQFDKYYEIEDVVFIKDPKQYRLYLKHGAKLADIFYSDESSNDGRIVLVFYKNSTYDLYKQWKDRTLK